MSNEFRSEHVPADPGFLRPDLSERGVNSDCLYLSYYVRGFWSSSTVSVKIERKYNSKDDTFWSMTSITGSSGGHEDNVTTQERARNHAAALIDAAAWADEIEEDDTWFEAKYQGYLSEFEVFSAKRAAEAKVKREAAQALVDADPGYDATEAKALVKACREHLDALNDVVILAVPRGRDATIGSVKVYRPIWMSGGRKGWERGEIRRKGSRNLDCISWMPARTGGCRVKDVVHMLQQSSLERTLVVKVGNDEMTRNALKPKIQELLGEEAE